VTGLLYGICEVWGFEIAVHKGHPAGHNAVAIRAFVRGDSRTEYIAVLDSTNHIKFPSAVNEPIVLLFSQFQSGACWGQECGWLDYPYAATVFRSVLLSGFSGLIARADFIFGAGGVYFNGGGFPYALKINRYQTANGRIFESEKYAIRRCLLSRIDGYICTSRYWREIWALFKSKLLLREAQIISGSLSGIFSGGGGSLVRTSLPSSDGCIDEKNDERGNFYLKSCVLPRILLLLFGVVLLHKVWMDRSFNFSIHMDMIRFVSQFIASYGMVVGGVLLMLFAFGLLA
jgi:hypothetical protein